MRGYVAAGSNLGDRRGNLAAALAALTARGVTPTAVSSLWETEPVGPPQPWYLNLVFEVETELAARALLAELQSVERRAGRLRTGRRNAPRTLDLDLLLLGGQVVDEPGLVVPHPRMGERRFVLAPLAELAPDLRPPGWRRTVAQTLALLPPTPRALLIGSLAAPLQTPV